MTTTQAPSAGLDALAQQVLSPAAQCLLDGLAPKARGSAMWRTRKLMETRELLALAELAPPGRMIIQHLDMAEELRAVYSLRVPAPHRDEKNSDVRIGDFATFALIYPQDAMRCQLHGFPFVQVIAPRPTWHPAIGGAPGMVEVMCIGEVAAGTRCSEIVLNSYSGMSMQNMRLDAFASMGAMNPAAVAYWQEHIDRLPLTKLGFLEPG